MSVSRERLDTLIAETARTAKTWKDFDDDQTAKNPEYESIVQSKCDDLLSALEELRYIRQAATAGVEEAIQRITLSLYGEFIETPCFDPSVPSAVASVKSLNRHRRKVYDANVSVLRETLAAELTALLAGRDAMLGECQSFIGKLSDRAERFHFADADRDTMAAMLSRIDALTKGGGDV